MRKYWWVTGILFVAGLAAYVVGSGWWTDHTLGTVLAHTRRQFDMDEILEDLDKAQNVLVQHRSRVDGVAFVIRNANHSSGDLVADQLAWFQYELRALKAVNLDERRGSDRFTYLTGQLAAYEPQSTSVLSPTWQGALKWGTLLLLILTLAMGAVRVFAGAE